MLNAVGNIGISSTWEQPPDRQVKLAETSEVRKTTEVEDAQPMVQYTQLRHALNNISRIEQQISRIEDL